MSLVLATGASAAPPGARDNWTPPDVIQAAGTAAGTDPAGPGAGGLVPVSYQPGLLQGAPAPPFAPEPSPAPQAPPLVASKPVIGSQLPAFPPGALQRPLTGSQMLERPIERQPETPPPAADFVLAPPPAPGQPLFRYPFVPPLGFAGPSSVLPTEEQGDNDFVPRPDRWRLGFPAWDRYGKGQPRRDDYPFEFGTLFNPYQQTVLKGDYPIIGQHTFFDFAFTSLTLMDGRQIPSQTTPFESTARPREFEFFGSPNQLLNNQFFFLRTELFHGDTAAFKPKDWSVVVTPVFNVNLLDVDELSLVNPDVRKGTSRNRNFLALQEYFVEAKLADLSPYYDFVSVRVGSQPLVSDFRGFLFSDVNRAIRIFGNYGGNRNEYNIALFRQAEKDTNSGLNTLQDRGQNVFIANYFRQDFLVPGYTLLLNAHYNHDPRSFKFDRNNFLVRPDPTGSFQPHSIDVGYLGWGGNGHFGRYNITHQVYYAFGNDTLNPIGNQAQQISAGFAAIELSYDRDYVRFRTSALWSSGDHNPNNNRATGFDSILDSPNFAGGIFSYWQRESLRLFGVGLNQTNSFIPDLRSSKIQGQSNFVNPGLVLINFGFDVDVTPKLKLINNFNYLWFENTQVLQQFTFDKGIDTPIGADLSLGFEYRPLLTNNVVILGSIATLIPGAGLKSLFNQVRDNLDPLVSAFMAVNVNF